MSTTEGASNPPASGKPEASANKSHTDEDRLAQALIGRGLIVGDEADSCRSGPDSTGKPEEFLKRLVKAGSLTPNQARRVAKELASLLHQDIPGYQLLEKLGQGSMGTVYKARQISLNRLVAVKMLHPRLAAKSDLLQRLVREAHAAAKLSHNNIVQAIDVGSAGNLHYFAMEYVEGTSIRDLLEKGWKFNEAEALDIIIPVAQALQHAHKRELIHRDVKPANIILTNDRVPKLADLGMARETENVEMAKAERGMTIGTPFYISPEQIRGRIDIDGRADIYSLGATLYHMVTGQPPFPGSKIEPVLEAHLYNELVPPDHLNTALSSGLGEVVEYMMAKDRTQRYNSAEDLLIDLECLARGQPPKLAHDRIDAGALEGLASGDDEEEENPEVSRRQAKHIKIGLIVVSVLFVLSLLVNIVMIFKPGTAK
ncbi:MAG TPA: serine/threonine-protein kinase [Gemmataceae bacterium]|nr:serine/threonine-protein kinase [Gemmataceae bacterium]